MLQRQLPLERPLRLAPADVHVWFLQFDRFPAPFALDPGRLPTPAGRRLQRSFLLRLLLSAYLPRNSASLRLGRSAAGKPRLLQPDSDLSFSVSDSGPWLAIAIARGIEPGLDIEVRSRRLRPEALARRWFPDNEARAVLGADDPRAVFLERWTAREAMIKARGATLGSALAGLALDPEQHDCPVQVPEGWPGTDCWRLIRPGAPEGVIACVAASSIIGSVTSFELLPPASQSPEQELV